MVLTVFERSVPDASAVSAALEGSKLGSFWIDSVARPRYTPLEADAHADLAIVGGGYSGLWTAILAKERDPKRDVVVLEGGRVGGAASGRNGGFCEPSLTHGRANGESRWPHEIDRLDALGSQNLDEIEATVARYGMDAEFERTGGITVAVEPHQLEWLGEDALDAAAVRSFVDSPTYLGGEFDGEGALVHPYKLAIELARVATELGVRIHERTPVRTMTGTDLVTKVGTVRARQVALGTNAFRPLLKRNRLMTVAVYDYVLVTEPLTEVQMASIGWEGRQGIGDMGNQFHYYRLTADNRILFGGYDAIYHAGGHVRREYEDRRETFEMLASHFLTTFPQLSGVKFTHRWAGAIDTCSRFSPFFGTARGGAVAYSLGFTGLGVAATRFGANVMLDLLDGESTERTETDMVRSRPLPFPPEPIASIGINLTRRSLNKADHREGKRDALLRTLDAVGMGFDS
ncbi:NAD(P)/FAD-dependent oxidoreductase [Demequina aurantiaca]|uniref:NAD(P)/FAD-dependent oxidoreductase n=1 Tax=Demequina aurantiaca TaxID=676200 RepID=UPI0007815091|nr:FAD-dependent oxidoreductase [Demequina aurantiaca]